MAGADNLKGKGFECRSAEEVREIARKGGKNSAASRKRKKSMRESARLLMELPVGKTLQQSMKVVGVSEEDANYEMALLVAMLQAGLQGNVSAAKLLVETAGEGADYRLNEAKLKLEREKFEYQKEREAVQEVEEVAEDALSRSLRELAENGLESD